MSYQALYRKFRPASFEEVKGQDAIVTTLKNQIINDRLGHAYLFCGTRGTGKTSVAKLFAKAVNCEDPIDGSPCGKCPTCEAIASGASLNVIEMDAASNNSVENVRLIVDQVTYPPTQGKYKVYIIDEVHNLSNAAFNALLKTLEEPPSYVKFVLATTEVHTLPITILSRCQRYDFRRIDIATIAERMKELMGVEGINAEDRALRYIAKCADGSMRDALSLLDQCLAYFMGEELTYDKALSVLGAVDTDVFSKFLGHIMHGDVTGAIRLLDEVVMLGRELSQFVTDFIDYLRNLMLVKACENIDDVVNVSTEHREQLQREAEAISDNTLMRYIRIFSDLSYEIRYSNQKRILIEMTLIRLCRPQTDTDNASILDRVIKLEKTLESGFSAAPAGYGQAGGYAPGPAGSGQMGGPAGYGQMGGYAPGSAGSGQSGGYGAPAGYSPAGAFVPGSIPGNAGQFVQSAKPLPKALPEDVKLAADRWRKIVDSMDNPFCNYARDARLSVEGDVLLLVFSDDVRYSGMKREDGMAQLKASLQKNTGKDVKFSLKLLDRGERFEASYVDIDVVRSRINMEIEEEDNDG